MIVLNAADTRAALPMPDAIEAMRWALATWSSGGAIVPDRLHLDLPLERGIGLVMPAYVPESDGREAAYAVKTLSGMTANPGRGLPLFEGATVLFDSETGRAVSVIDAGALTAIRTGACAGLATDLLARQDASTLSVIGAGAQGCAVAEAVCTVRRIREITVFDRHVARAEAAAAGFAALGASARVVTAPCEAVYGADVVCTATPSRTPLFKADDLAAGVHINAIGSFRREMRELPGAVISRALSFADNAKDAFCESGDFVQALEEGAIGVDYHVHEIGRLLLGKVAGRGNEKQLTLYKSVGLAAQDAVAAFVAHRNALNRGLGQTVTW